MAALKVCGVYELDKNVKKSDQACTTPDNELSSKSSVIERSGVGKITDRGAVVLQKW